MFKDSGVLEYSRFQIPYRIYGDKENVIVCVSGAKQTMSAWRSFISYFSKDYRIIVFDMPGQGRSEILSGSPGVPLLEQVDVLHNLLLHLNIESYQRRFLIGGSWGSIVSAVYAEHHPDTFHRLILGSFGTKPNAVLSSIIDQVQVYIQEGKGSEIAPMMIERFGQYIPESLKRQIVLQFNNMSEQQYQSFYEHSVFVSKLGDLKEHMNLQKILVPTLVVMGQFDTIMDLFDTKSSTKLIPEGRFHLVKGVGHFLHWEQSSVLPVYDDFFAEDVLQRSSSNLA